MNYFKNRTICIHPFMYSGRLVSLSYFISINDVQGQVELCNRVILKLVILSYINKNHTQKETFVNLLLHTFQYISV